MRLDTQNRHSGASHAPQEVLTIDVLPAEPDAAAPEHMRLHAVCTDRKL